MKGKGIFITGIGTDIGKTIASAILVEKFEADYWKPIQSGDLHFSDTDKVKSLVSNARSQFLPEYIRLKNPFSPHKAADLENVEIHIQEIEIPNSKNFLFIEGAGGLMVPLNKKETLLDFIKLVNFPVVLVSKNYLGSINHTLLSISKLRQENLAIQGILFMGEKDPYTEGYILENTGVCFLGRIPILESLTKESIKEAGKDVHFALDF